MSHLDDGDSDGYGQSADQLEDAQDPQDGSQDVSAEWQGAYMAPMQAGMMAPWGAEGYPYVLAGGDQWQGPFMAPPMEGEYCYWNPENYPFLQAVPIMPFGAGLPHMAYPAQPGAGSCGGKRSGPTPQPGTAAPYFSRPRSSHHGGDRGSGRSKQRFCATFPNVARCRHGAACAFAHSREEIGAPLLSVEEEMRLPGAMTEDFFTERFKTLWCPIGMQHDWQVCMYAHTYQDVRRPPSIGYGHQLCPYWSKKETTLAYSQRCPLGPRCPYSHGAKEQLYHPGYFRTLNCRDLQRRRCPRRQLCAFYHKSSECRQPSVSAVDYTKPLKKEKLPEEWLSYFLSPPHFQDVCDPQDGTGAMDMAAASQAAVMDFHDVGVAGEAEAEWADDGQESDEEAS